MSQSGDEPGDLMATILVVDDCPTNRDLLVTLLGYRGHKSLEAGNGAEALALARAERPDLIITDILMPAMDGYEFTRRLREDPDIGSTPVIFHSAHYLLEEARVLAAKCGVPYVIVKPCDPSDVLAAVDKALSVAQEITAPIAAAEFDLRHVQVLTDKLSQSTQEMFKVYSRLEALVEIGRELNVTQDPALLLERYCRGAREIMGARCATARITDHEGCEISRLCGFGRGENEAGPGSTASPRQAASIQAVSRLECERGCMPAANGIECPVRAPAERAYLAAPIMTRNRTYGWMGLSNKVGNLAFSADDERLLGALVAQLAVAYENSRLFEELKRRAAELECEVTERRQQAEKYRMLIEQASDGILVMDEDGNCREVNATLIEMLGYTREELLEFNLQDLIYRDELARDPARFSELREGNAVRKARRLVRKDGNTIETEISTAPLEDGRFQSIIRDMTDHNNLESQLRQAQKLEAVGRLAGGVAHDFNNLLTVIIGHSDLAMSGLDEDEPRHKDIEQIRAAGERAAILTNQLLAFSRKGVLQPKVVDVNSAVTNLSKMLGRLIHADIELVTRLDPRPARVKIDPGRLDQVILNLAVNARDAMPLGGKLIIETSNRKIETEGTGDYASIQPGSYVMLSVTDTGCGMDAETRSHVFEPFFTTKAPGKGTGLGLSTVYGMVHQSGGHIFVQSEPAQGSTFKILLPSYQGPPVPAERPQLSGTLPEGNETVLLVEDEARVRSLASIILRQLGYTVLEATDGQEGLNLALRYEGDIHLLLSDIIMPKMGGKDLAEKLMHERPGLKVLFCSGYTEDPLGQSSVLHTKVPLLQKPFTPRTLADAVRRALSSAAEPSNPAARSDRTSHKPGSRDSRIQ
jgi:PAS domain S-box-containing protein